MAETEAAVRNGKGVLDQDGCDVVAMYARRWLTQIYWTMSFVSETVEAQAAS